MIRKRGLEVDHSTVFRWVQRYAPEINKRSWHVRRDGSRFWADGLLMFLRGEGGEPLGFAKIMRDATAEKQAETRLREREE